MSNTVAVTSVVTLSILVGACVVQPATAQTTPPPFTAKQCDDIRTNIIGIFKRYDGKLSEQLVADLKQFSRRNCDRSVKLRMMAGTLDKDAISELKILIAARQL